MSDIRNEYLPARRELFYIGELRSVIRETSVPHRSGEMWFAETNSYGVHVLPDGEEHLLHSACDCKPEVIDAIEMTAPVIIHYAFDGREDIELREQVTDLMLSTSEN